MTEYNESETVTMSLQRYDELNSNAESKIRDYETYLIALEKLTELGYVVVRHPIITRRPEIMLKSDFDKMNKLNSKSKK